jgi:hypothetical protein
MRRLEALLETLRTAPIPTVEEHNEIIDSLYSRIESNQVHWQNIPLTSFAAILEKLGHVSSTLGFVYGLLSWEIFRREEQRLVRNEKLSAIAASKAANKQMAETLNRRAKTRDWASDGRKASKMVFNTLKQRNSDTVESSFAVLLLAANVSLDGMLKIAHFPATRERFVVDFGEIVEGMSEHCKQLAERGYKTFDYERFLECRGACASRR